MKLNLKIMKTRPEVSDEELRSFMNFDALLERRKAALQKTGRLNMLRNGAILTGTVILLSVVWYMHRGDPALTQGEQAVPEETSPTLNAPAEMPPADTVVATPETDDANKASTPAVKPQQQETQAPKSVVKEQEPESESETRPDDDYTYMEATPVDGFPALYEYFNRELVYPVSAIPDSIQGVVTVNFVIDANGAPENIRIENSLGPAFDDEVNRLIRNMPAWKPAAVNGKPVPSRLAIPITFRLEKIR